MFLNCQKFNLKTDIDGWKMGMEIGRNVERYGYEPKGVNKGKTVSFFEPGMSFSTVNNVKILGRITVVRSKREAVVYSHGDTVDQLAFEEKKQLTDAMERVAKRCLSGNVVFSEHRGSLRSLKRFHTHIIFDHIEDYKKFIPFYNHKYLEEYDHKKRTSDLIGWSAKDYELAEQRSFKLAMLDPPRESDKLNDDVAYDTNKGCSKLHLPIFEGQNPLDTVYDYIRRYGLKNYHYGLVYSPGGRLIDIFIHIYPPEFVDHVFRDRKESLCFITDYLANFKIGIDNHDFKCMIVT